MSWAEVKKINSDMGKSLDTLITEQVALVNSNVDDLEAIAKTINNRDVLKYGAIKSVQRGVAITSMDSNSLIINIGRVTLAKTFIPTRSVSFGVGTVPIRATLELKAANLLEIKFNKTVGAGITVPWEVVEFY